MPIVFFKFAQYSRLSEQIQYIFFQWLGDVIPKNLCWHWLEIAGSTTFPAVALYDAANLFATVSVRGMRMM